MKHSYEAQLTRTEGRTVGTHEGDESDPADEVKEEEVDGGDASPPPAL